MIISSEEGLDDLKVLKSSNNTLKEPVDQSSEESATKEILKAESEDHVSIFPEGSVERVLDYGKQVKKNLAESDLKKRADDVIAKAPEVAAYCLNTGADALRKVTSVVDGIVKMSFMDNNSAEVVEFQKKHGLKKPAQN